MKCLEDVDINEISKEVSCDGHFSYNIIECMLRIRDRYNLSECDSVKLVSALKDLGYRQYQSDTVSEVVDFYGSKNIYNLEFDGNVRLGIYESPLKYAASEGVLYLLFKYKLYKHIIESKVLDKLVKYYEQKLQKIST